MRSGSGCRKCATCGTYKPRISINDAEHRTDYRLDFETWSENNPEAISGLHNLGKRIVVIFDETSGIPPPIWKHIQGALTDKNTEIIWLAYGNGTLNEGPFFECFHKNAHRWNTRHIDTRTVEGTNREEIQQWLEDEGEDSDWFPVHVRGLFPRQSELQFIGRDVVERANHYKAVGYEELPKILACDVARSEAGAQTVFGYRQGRKYVELEKYRGQSITFTANSVIHWINEIKPDATVIDASGLGIGVVDTCTQLGYTVQAFNGGEAAFDSRKYGNRRAETWGLGKLCIEAGAEIPDDEHLASQITGPHYFYRKGQSLHGALMIEPKEQMARRGLASPDRADTLMLTHAVEPAPKEVEAMSEWRRRSERVPTNWMDVQTEVVDSRLPHHGSKNPQLPAWRPAPLPPPLFFFFTFGQRLTAVETDISWIKSGLKLTLAAQKPTSQTSVKEVSRITSELRAKGVKLDQGLLVAAGTSFLKAAKADSNSWPAVISLLDYKSFVNEETAPKFDTKELPIDPSKYHMSLSFTGFSNRETGLIAQVRVYGKTSTDKSVLLDNPTEPQVAVPGTSGLPWTRLAIP